MAPTATPRAEGPGPASAAPGSPSAVPGSPPPSGTPGPNAQAAQWPRASTRGWSSLISRETWSGVRRPRQRVLGGVASALAETVGVSVLAARWALVALTCVGGAGFVIYIAGWLFLPSEGAEQPIARTAFSDRRTVSLVLAAVSLLIVLMVSASVLGASTLLGIVSPGIISLACLVAVWRHADADDRAAARRLAGLLSGTSPTAVPTWRRVVGALVRLLVGAALIAVGTSTLLQPGHLNGADLTVAFAALGVIAGFALVLAPWWLRLGRELSGERRERARAEERAEMAEHLHDSVLQTLALIQRAAGDPQQVQRLARARSGNCAPGFSTGRPAASQGWPNPALFPRACSPCSKT